MQPDLLHESLEETDLFQQVTNLLRALAKAQPLLLILDDLQWADPLPPACSSTWDGAWRAAASSSLAPIVPKRLPHVMPVCASPVQYRILWRKYWAELQRQFGDVRLDLAGSRNQKSATLWIAFWMLSPIAWERLSTALFAHTHGHPLFTVELLRAMQERGDLIQEEDGIWVEGPALDWGTLPPRVEGIIKPASAASIENLWEFLAVASVEGETFTAQVWPACRG